MKSKESMYLMNMLFFGEKVKKKIRHYTPLLEAFIE